MHVLLGIVPVLCCSIHFSFASAAAVDGGVCGGPSTQIRFSMTVPPGDVRPGDDGSDGGCGDYAMVAKEAMMAMMLMMRSWRYWRSWRDDDGEDSGDSDDKDDGDYGDDGDCGDGVKALEIKCPRPERASALRSSLLRRIRNYSH